jgi:hypothetical protein
MGIHYDYKSKRGERAMLKEAKRKERLALKKAKRASTNPIVEKKKSLLKCMISASRLLWMILTILINNLINVFDG